MSPSTLPCLNSFLKLPLKPEKTERLIPEGTQIRNPLIISAYSSPRGRFTPRIQKFILVADAFPFQFPGRRLHGHTFLSKHPITMSVQGISVCILLTPTEIVNNHFCRRKRNYPAIKCRYIQGYSTKQKTMKKRINLRYQNDISGPAEKKSERICSENGIL